MDVRYCLNCEAGSRAGRAPDAARPALRLDDLGFRLLKPDAY